MREGEENLIYIIIIIIAGKTGFMILIFSRLNNNLLCKINWPCRMANLIHKSHTHTCTSSKKKKKVAAKPLNHSRLSSL